MVIWTPFECAEWMEIRNSRSASLYWRLAGINLLVSLQGSVFVEFTDASSVDAFLNADPKPSWNGEELLIMTK